MIAQIEDADAVIIVDAAEITVEAQEIPDQLEEVLDIEDAPLELLVEGQLGVELETSDLREVVLPLIEE